MEITAQAVMAYIIPVVRIVLWMGISFGVTSGLGYFLFVVMRRRRWYSDIYEKKADGKLHLVAKDVLVEKKVNKGKQRIYVFRNARSEGFPPSDECVYRVKNKEYCDYVRVREDYIPLKKEIDGTINLPTGKAGLIETIKTHLRRIKGMSAKELERNYVHIPIHKAMCVKVRYTPMEYDVNMMRLNAIEMREKIYADRKDFWEKYGTMIAVGMVVVLIIVVLYMSYGYSETVIQSALGAAKDQGKSILLDAAKSVAGTPPPQ